MQHIANPDRRTGTVLRAAAGLVAAGIALSLPAIASAQTQDEIYEAAKKEGKVVFWSVLDKDPMSVITAGFQKAFPGIEVEHFEIQPGPAAQRMIAEAQAGQVNLDVVHSDIPYLEPSLDRDLLEPYDWSKSGIDPQVVAYDGRCITLMNLGLPIIVNTSMVQPDDIKGWDDLLDPKWKGKIAVEARGKGLAILLQEWGEEKTGQFVDGLKANGALIVKGSTPTMEAVAGGQVAIALGSYIGKVIDYQEKGAPVDWARVGPLPVEDQFVCMTRKAPHPNAGRLFGMWLTTREGQDALWQTQHFGHIVGPVLDPSGEEVKAKGIAVVNSDPEPAESQKRQAWVAKRIAGL